MNEEAKVPMTVFNKLPKAKQIKALCDYHECSSSQRKLHYRQYVQRRWNPHPPEQFAQWWPAVGWQQTEAATERAWKGVSIEDAFNCEAVRVVYREGKETGTLFEKPEINDPDRGLSIRERLTKLKALIAQIGKPMTKPLQRDWDKGKAPWKEPIDEQKALPEAGVVDAEFTKLEDEEIPF
jgi:hypothetical protein